MKNQLVIFLFFISINLFSQEGADEILKKIDVSESIYLDSLYIELFYIYKNIDSEKALSYAEKSLEFAERFKHFERISEAYYAKGIFYSKNYKYELAEENFNRSLDYAMRHDLDRRILIAYANLGIVNIDKFDYDVAIDYLLKSLQYAIKINDISYQSGLYNNIGLIHYRLGDFREALKYYELSLDLKKQLENESEILINYSNIGLCYNALKDYVRAIEYFQYILDNCNDCNERQIVDSYYGLGKAYFGLELYDKALDLFETAISLATQENLMKTIAYSELYIAKIYFEKEDYKNALKYLRESEQISRKYNFVQNQRDNYQLYSTIYETLGDFKKALEYNNSFIAYKDSIISEELLQNLKNSYLEFQRLQSDEIIAGKDDVIENRTKFMMMMGIILILVMVVLIFTYRSLTFRSRLNKKLDGMVKEKTKELILSNEELVKSRGELDSFLYRTSHDIRGPIATLLGLTSLAKLEAKDPLMSTYLDKINVTADKLNEVISRLTNVSQINSQPLDVQNTDVYYMVNEVIGKLKKSAINGVSFKLGGPPPTQIKTDKILLEIILENLLENSFKFYDSNESNSYVNLDIQQNGNLELTVTDNGIGIDNEFKDKIFDLFFVANEKERGTGIGLYQTQLATKKLLGKIELINNRKPTKFKLVFPDITEGLEKAAVVKEEIV